MFYLYEMPTRLYKYIFFLDISLGGSVSAALPRTWCWEAKCYAAFRTGKQIMIYSNTNHDD